MSTKQTRQGRDSEDMDKVKKILSSPLSRRRNINNNPALTANSSGSQAPASAPAGPGYLGVPLEELVAREGVTVPRLVTSICDYVRLRGINSEGVFRVNGNQRVVEKLRAQFERTGNADLEACGDVMSAASLLKLFVRELPDGLVPASSTHRFVKAQQEFSSDKQACLSQLRTLLLQLPGAHYACLAYLCRFLQELARHEADNKMSPMALGIVFGPNVFRCSAGLQGLKDQGVTNYVTASFITNCDVLFPNDEVKNGKKRAAPPPPRQNAHPTASPRKHKSRGGERGSEAGEADTSARSSDAHPSLHGYSDDDVMDNDRLSPFPLETDRSEYSINTTSHSFTTSEAVDRIISSVVEEHLFGDVSSDPHLTSEEEGMPVAPPRRKRSQGTPQAHRIRIDDERESTSERDSEDELRLTVKQRIQQMEQDPHSNASTLSNGHSNGPSNAPSRHAKQRPTSQAFELFEKKGLVIGPAPEGLRKTLALGGDGAEVAVESDDASSAADDQHMVTSPVPAPRMRAQERRSDGQMEGEEEGTLSGLHTSHTMLASFKKPAGPKNRRTPTRRGVKSMPDNTADSLTYSITSNTGDEEKENPDPADHITSPHLEPHLPVTTPLHLHIPSQQLSPPNDNAPTQGSPSTKFLDVPYNGNAQHGSPDKSPAEARKPYVPPLDLSILHEHGDGSDPISVQHGQSVSLHKVQPASTHSQAIVSPRADKVHAQKFTGEPDLDTNLAPSPPIRQLSDPRLQRVEEDYASQVKQYTKKIQTCKRRIKQFEEAFEAEQGYRPSQTDKAARPDIKRCMQDLAKARKDLRRVKEEQQRANSDNNLSAGGTGNHEKAESGSVGGGDTMAGTPSMRDSLHALMKRLTEKRREGSRPEDLSLMTWEQVQEEKLAVQKTLLHFESIHGRPSTKAEKELMRPLYDRYRNVKRMLAKGPPAPAPQSDLLQTVPEDTAIELEPGSAKTTVSNRDPIRIPTAEPDADEQNFLVTRDLRLLGDTVVPGNRTLGPSNGITSPLAGTSKGGWMNEDRDGEMDGDTIGGGTTIGVTLKNNNKNLHEMTVPQLLEEQSRAREDKKRLRKLLREFEDEFHSVTGRKVMKDDRAPMSHEYQEYKQVKARLKLVDALLSKHDASPDL